MQKISIVPDTNTFINNLSILKDLFVYDFPCMSTFNISRTVIRELDNLKNDKLGARDAIKFIESISCSIKTEIEGHIDDRKIDIEVVGNGPIKESNNDDKILNYIFKLENPILLTNDVAFALKANAFNIKYIMLDKCSLSSTIDKINSLICGNPIDCGNSEVDALIAENRQIVILFDNMKINMKSIIEPIIHQIFYKEFGDSHTLLITGDFSLEKYLELVVQNTFFLKNI